MQNNEPSETTTKLKFSLDMRLLIGVLLAVIIAMLLIWRPWTSRVVSDRTIDVTGESTVKAEPDEYVFYPSYEFKNADKQAALTELTKKSDDVVSKLKALGVNDSKIKTNSSGYDFPVYYNNVNDPKEATYTLQLTVTTADKALAQKVQDYLVTTVPTGSVSPTVTFSESKRKQLENQGRDAATKEARTKADQSAKNLGFKLGKVKTISDGSGFNSGGCGSGLACPLAATTDLKASGAPSSLTVQPGENELSYSVSVTYFIK